MQPNDQQPDPRRKPPNKTLVVILLSALGVLVVCVVISFGGLLTGSGEDESAARPTPANTAAYLQELAFIDPSLDDEPMDALREGRDICLDILRNKDDDTVVRNAAEAFDVDEAKARQIVEAAHRHLCSK